MNMIKGFENGGYICECGKILPRGVMCCPIQSKKLWKKCLLCNSVTDNNIFCSMGCYKNYFTLINTCKGCGGKMHRVKDKLKFVSEGFCTKKCQKDYESTV